MQSMEFDPIALFMEIAAIPRPSGQEARIAEWLVRHLAGCGIAAERDGAGNVLARVPASPGRESAPHIVLQAHMDMVAVAEPECHHDFSRDPIRAHRNGDWLCAAGTTLGADNGIGMALALSLAADPAVSHGPLTLLFTVSEETGMDGANALVPGVIQPDGIINLDTCDEGIFIVGCAGGMDVAIRRACVFTPTADPCWRLSVEGMAGGHSGLEIHRRRTNAAGVLARLLLRLREAGGVRLVSFQAGTARNAIPSSACAVVTTPLPAARIQEVYDALVMDTIALAPEESGLVIQTEPYAPAAGALDSEESARAMDLLLALPFGVRRMVADSADLVETSNNLSPVVIDGEGFRIDLMIRSLLNGEMAALAESIGATARLAGADVTATRSYPAWTPRFESRLLAVFRERWRALTGTDALVRVIHAGLECGILAERLGGAEVISVGPDIRGVHTPHERCFIPSVLRTRALVADVLATLSREAPDSLNRGLTVPTSSL